MLSLTLVLAMITLPSETFLKPSFWRISSYGGILMPAGTTAPSNANTSSDVKSGFKYTSFSKSLFHGKSARKLSAFFTNVANFADVSLSTMDTSELNSAETIILLIGQFGGEDFYSKNLPRMPAGSRYGAIEPK